jgi:transcription initiation factor TFIIH subunit 3
MILHILLDLDVKQWPILDGKDLFNNLQIFINAYRISCPSNCLKIINSQEFIYDSERDSDMFQIIEKYNALRHNSKMNGDLDQSKEHNDKKYCVNDLGFSILHKPNRILIYNMGHENQEDYLKYLKCMFVAQKHGIRIDAFSYRDNMFIKMCSKATNGVYLNSTEVEGLIGTLGNIKPDKDINIINCLCCNKEVNIALICPICLSLYCKFIPVCKRCKTKFSFNK